MIKDIISYKLILFCLCICVACNTPKKVSTTDNYEKRDWTKLTSKQRLVAFYEGAFKAYDASGNVYKFPNTPDSCYVLVRAFGDPNRDGLCFYREQIMSSFPEKPLTAGLFRIHQTAPDSFIVDFLVANDLNEITGAYYTPNLIKNKSLSDLVPEGSLENSIDCKDTYVLRTAVTEFQGIQDTCIYNTEVRAWGTYREYSLTPTEVGETFTYFQADEAGIIDSDSILRQGTVILKRVPDSELEQILGKK